MDPMLKTQGAISRHASSAAVALLFTLAACSGDDPVSPGPGTGSAAEVPPNAQVVAFDVVQEVTTPISGIVERRRAVIANAAEWAELWDEMQSRIEPKPPVPEIDFGSHMVVFASMGERTSGGYTISVLEAAAEDDALYVEIEEATPGIECITTDVISTPAVAVSVPNTASKVLFVEREIAYPCAPNG
jgi:hypothetical protein